MLSKIRLDDFIEAVENIQEFNISYSQTNDLLLKDILEDLNSTRAKNNLEDLLITVKEQMYILGFYEGLIFMKNLDKKR